MLPLSLGWNASPSQGYSPAFHQSTWQFACTCLYSWVERALWELEAKVPSLITQYNSIQPGLGVHCISHCWFHFVQIQLYAQWWPLVKKGFLTIKSSLSLIFQSYFQHFPLLSSLFQTAVVKNKQFTILIGLKAFTYYYVYLKVRFLNDNYANSAYSDIVGPRIIRTSPGGRSGLSVCIFSILFSIHLLRYWEGEFVKQSFFS